MAKKKPLKATLKAETPALTYPRRKTSTLLMGCGGKGKPMQVIDGDRLMEYVGIGWIELRIATAADKLKYPTVVDD